MTAEAATSAESAAQGARAAPARCRDPDHRRQLLGEPRVLLGRRRLDMVFMPGRYVFPGGRVDPADKQIDVEEDLRRAISKS